MDRSAEKKVTFTFSEPDLKAAIKEYLQKHYKLKNVDEIEESQSLELIVEGKNEQVSSMVITDIKELRAVFTFKD